MAWDAYGAVTQDVRSPLAKVTYSGNPKSGGAAVVLNRAKMTWYNVTFGTTGYPDGPYKFGGPYKDVVPPPNTAFAMMDPSDGGKKFEVDWWPLGPPDGPDVIKGTVRKC